jgi:hypothetical protein
MLRRLFKSCYFDTVINDFNQEDPKNPKDRDRGEQRWTGQHPKAHAVYNNDKKFYTPAFMFGMDMRTNEKYSLEELQKFETKKLDILVKLGEEEPKIAKEFLVPKPVGKKCQICK